MYACALCGILYLTQREADLCSPVREWPTRYPHLVDQKITDQNSAFTDQENEDQKND